jgi:hypothetical protein
LKDSKGLEVIARLLEARGEPIHVSDLAPTSASGGEGAWNRLERARKAARWRIRDGIERIARRHPTLGEHLRVAITTGTLCRYESSAPTTWAVEDDIRSRSAR